MPAVAVLVLVEERNHAVIEQIGRHQARLGIVEFGEGQLGVDVDKGLGPVRNFVCLSQLVNERSSRGQLLRIGHLNRNDGRSQGWP